MDLLRPLPPAALAVIGKQPEAGEFVFPSIVGGALCVSGSLKGALSGHRSMDQYTLHDLRRTARSLMSRAGVPTDHAERCLGHVIGGVRGVYDRYEYREGRGLREARSAG